MYSDLVSLCLISLKPASDNRACISSTGIPCDFFIGSLIKSKPPAFNFWDSTFTTSCLSKGGISYTDEEAVSVSLVW